MRKKRIDAKSLLIEIDVQDLPVSYIRPAIGQLERYIRDGLERLRIRHGAVTTGATKNILLCLVKDVSPYQEEITEEVVGPSERVAFDASGNLTEQGIGFAMAQGVGPGALRIKETPRGRYVCTERHYGREKTDRLIRGVLKDAINNIHFPKTMKWDPTGIRFARPIDAILVIFGATKITVRIGNIPTKRVQEKTISAYLKRLGGSVILDPERRKKIIKNLVFRKAASEGGDRKINEGLLEEVTFLVDAPRAFCGSYGRSFLSLPREVLIASMSKHQRVFPVFKKGRIINRFVAVTNGRSLAVSSVRRNYENILDARLKDSVFFFREDTKRPLEEYTPQLKDLIFHRDLGNMFQKIQRLRDLCAFFCDEAGLDGSLRRDAVRAAELCKSDLVTHMVGEFPSLQGVIGGIYAMASGESNAAAIAIKEHYLPHGADSKLPASMPGSVLAICDRMDNVTGFLGIGVEAKGSYDPFAIRRSCQGMIQILRARGIGLDIGKIVEYSIGLYGDLFKAKKAELKDRVLEYIKERIEYLLGDIRPVELKKAVLASDTGDVVDIFKRMEVLSGASSSRRFLEAAKVVERTGNILKAARDVTIPDRVMEDLFREDLEKELWNAYLKNRDIIEGLINQREYLAATEKYAEAFYGILHDFFDRVLVNVEDDRLRLNRLAMIRDINRLYAGRVADLAQLPQIVVNK